MLLHFDLWGDATILLGSIGSKLLNGITISFFTRTYVAGTDKISNSIKVKAIIYCNTIVRNSDYFEIRPLKTYFNKISEGIGST